MIPEELLGTYHRNKERLRKVGRLLEKAIERGDDKKIKQFGTEARAYQHIIEKMEERYLSESDQDA